MCFSRWLAGFWLLVLAGFGGAAPLKVLSIGDSLTEEYRFETPFSAPESAPGVPGLEANTKNWVEIVSARRGEWLSFGSYDPNLLSYPDFRNGGVQV